MKSILLFSLIAMSGACVDQLDDNEDLTTDETPRLAVNGMLPSQMQYTSLDQAPLTASSISYLAATADGRAYLNYVVGCALDGTQSLSAGGYTFVGSIGMVPAWTTRALSLSERRWVSACVLARTNYIGTSQQISIRGTHPALVLGTDATWSHDEGAFYGDIFSGSSQQNRRACSGSAVYDGSLTYYKGRRCTFVDDATPSQTMCLFAYDGDCSARCAVSNGVYTSCTDTNNTVWNEVVKVHDN